MIADRERRLDDFHGDIARFNADARPVRRFGLMSSDPCSAPRADFHRGTMPPPASPATMRADWRWGKPAAKLAELKAVKALGADDPDVDLTQRARSGSAIRWTSCPKTSMRPSGCRLCQADRRNVRQVAALLAAIGKRKAAENAKLGQANRRRARRRRRGLRHRLR